MALDNYVAFDTILREKESKAYVINMLSIRLCIPHQ
jgi:hypothetical protein